MNRLLKAACVASVAVVMGFTTGARAAVVLTPAGLSPGDTYHLVFLTAGVRDATSSVIGDYNDFVTTEVASLIADLLAAGYPGVTWKVIGSTAAEDARDNIGVISDEIYRTDGVLVAANEAALFDASSNHLLASINITQAAVSLGVSTAWTGSD